MSIFWRTSWAGLYPQLSSTQPAHFTAQISQTPTHAHNIRILTFAKYYTEPEQLDTPSLLGASGKLLYVAPVSWPQLLLQGF